MTGVTHMYSPPGRNSTNPSANATEFALPYMMHYITLPVTPGMKYTYSVKSGSGLGYGTVCLFVYGCPTLIYLSTFHFLSNSAVLLESSRTYWHGDDKPGSHLYVLRLIFLC